MSKVRLTNLCKKFGDVQAVDDVDIEISQGEFFSLLGPSGCGKTTTLRMLAGFEYPTSGQILFDDVDVTFLKPNLRNTGMVFQNFALFPHMNVFENVAFGLQARKTGRTQIRDKVEQALDLVNMQGYETRKIAELSGGQQQRVALARAVVIEPAILLLDEPLSNLDAKLRESTRSEIKALQQRLGITTIYVTHDQEEALTLSDRIAVMQAGRIQQIDTPEQIYRQPVNEFVATFVGNSNILKGRIEIQDNVKKLNLADQWQIQFAEGLDRYGGLEPGRSVVVGLRPENIRLKKVSTAEGAKSQTASIRTLVISGSLVDYKLQIHGLDLDARCLINEHDFFFRAGTSVQVVVNPENLMILGTDS
jgi:iron(III) transport system ATP-binding protein